jgi:hypothetical protein
MKKVSAVDWLIDSYFGGLGMVTPNFRKFIKQAKEMEKEQDKNSEQDIKSAYNEGAFAQLRYRDGKKWVDSNEWFENIKNKQQ